MPVAQLSDIVDESAGRVARLDDIVDVAPPAKPRVEDLLGPMKPVPVHQASLPPERQPQTPLSKPGELERQLAWSLSPARDALAARRHQPPANVPEASNRAALSDIVSVAPMQSPAGAERLAPPVMQSPAGAERFDPTARRIPRITGFDLPPAQPRLAASVTANDNLVGDVARGIPHVEPGFQSANAGEAAAAEVPRLATDASRLAYQIDDPRIDQSRAMAQAKGFAAGAVEAAGRVIQGQFDPVNLGLWALGFGSVKLAAGVAAEVTDAATLMNEVLAASKQGHTAAEIKPMLDELTHIAGRIRVLETLRRGVSGVQGVAGVGLGAQGVGTALDPQRSIAERLGGAAQAAGGAALGLSGIQGVWQPHPAVKALADEVYGTGEVRAPKNVTPTPVSRDRQLVEPGTLNPEPSVSSGTAKLSDIVQVESSSPATDAAAIASQKGQIEDLLAPLKGSDAETPKPVPGETPPDATAAAGAVAPPSTAVPAAPGASPAAGEPAGGAGGALESPAAAQPISDKPPKFPRGYGNYLDKKNFEPVKTNEGWRYRHKESGELYRVDGEFLVADNRPGGQAGALEPLPTSGTAKLEDIVDVAPAETPAVEKPAPSELHVRRELGRIAAELEAMPFTKRGFVDAGAGKGGDLEVVPGAAGAPVYDDILQAAPGTSKYTRAEVASAVRKYLESGKLTNPARGAIDVARGRLAGGYRLGDRALSKPQLPPDAGDEPGKIYVKRDSTRAPDLLPVQERAADLVESKPAEMIARYRQEFPDTISADDAKKLFPDYATSEQRTANETAIHPAGVALAQAVFDQVVKEPTPQGHAPTILFSAGGTGSGKTTGLDYVRKLAGPMHAAYDSTLSDRKWAFRNIDRALDEGKGVTVVFTYRPIEDAFRGVLTRAMKTGRPVTIPAHVGTHAGALDVVHAIHERYGDHVELIALDNSGPEGALKIVPLDALPRPDYTDPDVRQALHDILDAEEAAGATSESIARATRGREGRGRPDSGRISESRHGRETTPQQKAPVDILDTGEAQPRLPGAADVRKPGKVDTFDLPVQSSADFSLEGKPTDEAAARDAKAEQASRPGLFEPEPEAPKRKGGGGGNAMRIEERPQTSAGRGSPQAAVVPGLKEFVEEDVVPGARQAVTDLNAARLDIKTLFAPASASAAARDFSHIVRPNGSARDQRIQRAQRVTKALSKMFDRQLRGAKTDAQLAKVLLGFTDAVEAGEAKNLPAPMREAAALFRELYRPRVEAIQAMGRLQQANPHYFAHVWAEPKKALSVLGTIISKRPLQGSKAFLKQRSIPTTREGIEAGLKPVSYNPVELTLLKLAEMDKFIAASHILRDGQKQGLAKYVAIGEEPPEGWRRFDHSFATVYGKPTVTIKEAYDKILMDKLEAFAESLGVQLERKESIGGNAWGLAYGDKRIVTRFAGPETVLEHEIGHILDERYGLRHGMVNKKLYRQELRDLADLRDEGTPARDIPPSRHRYVRKGEEKIANLVHAFIYNPEKAKKVAPNSYWLLYNMAKSTPALRPLIDLQKARSLTLTAATTEKPIGGALIKGYYYGPPEVVRLLDNHLSPGLRGSPTVQIYRRLGNFLNQVQLGLSAFHLTMTGMESVISKQSLAFELLARGELGAAARKQLEVPIAPFVDLVRGHKALRQFYEHDANAQTIDDVMDAVVQGGGGFGWSLFEHEGAPAKFMQALRQGNYPGAALRAIPALVELQAKPIMEGWVPRLKMAAFLDLARMEMKTLGPEPDLAEARRVFGDAWDSIDNRFGQLRYDNLFWHTALKDLGMASVRALGWNIGSVREAAGAPAAQLKQLGLVPGGGTGGAGGGGKRPTRLRDAGVGPDGEPKYEAVKEPWLHRKTAWLVATVFIYGLAGAIYQYLHTGEGPKELKDYFFPKDESGKRMSLPGYMKDWYAFAHHPVTTVTHKLNPLLSLVGDVFSNQDYFGTAIRNPDDPRSTQLKDLFDYVANDYVPISIRNFAQRHRDQVLQHNSDNAIESFFGIGRAPASVNLSDAEELVRRYHPPQSRTKAQAADSDLTRTIRQGLQGKTPEGRAAAVAAARSGDLSRRQVQNAIRGARQNALQAGVKSLSLDQTLRVYEVATPDERALLKPILLRKVASIAEAAPNDRQALRARAKTALALPASVRRPAVESAFR